MTRHAVARVADIPVGGRVLAEVEGRSIGIFNLGGEFFALRNVCPHQAAPVCRGNTCGLVKSTAPGHFEYSREGEILRCPWHHWEFDIRTGRSVFDPETTRIRVYGTQIGTEPLPDRIERYPVAIDKQWIFVEV